MISNPLHQGLFGELSELSFLFSWKVKIRRHPIKWLDVILPCNYCGKAQYTKFDDNKLPAPTQNVIISWQSLAGRIMIIANINSQTWPQTKFVISLAMFQIIVIILFCIFVRYDQTIDAKLAGNSTPAYDPYPCMSQCRKNGQIFLMSYIFCT